MFLFLLMRSILPLSCLTNFHMQNFIHESGCVVMEAVLIIFSYMGPYPSANSLYLTNCIIVSLFI